MDEGSIHSDLDALVRHSSDLVAVVDRDGSIREGSNSVEQLLGYDAATLAGRNLLEYVHPDDREATLTAVSESPGPDDDRASEFRFRHADDSWVWLEVVRSAGGDPDRGGYVVASRSLVADRRADEGRDAVLRGMTDGFCALDEHRRLAHVNERAEELLGRDRDALVGAGLGAAFPGESGDELERRIAEVTADGEPATFDFRYGPEERLLSVQVYPSDSGTTLYFSDVTEQRRVATELEESVAALHRLYKLASNTELAFAEKQSRVLELGCSHLGLPYGFVTRMTDDEQTILDSTGDHALLQPGESCPIEESYCRKTVQTEGILAMHDAVEAGFDDDVAYEVFQLGSYVGGKLVVDGELYGTLCFAASEARGQEFTDSERAFVEVATRWLAYELERREYQRQLEDRNERLEEFASFVSHDLRNPLNVAEGELELAMSEVDNEHLDEVAWAHDRMRELIGDLLSLARGGDELEDPTTVHLPALADRCWRNVDTADATLLVDVEGHVAGDEGRLRQLFENLFRNAVEHGGDSVTVTVGNLDGGFYVADDGAGIPGDERDQVFEAGFTTEESGTGIGLQIVAQVADAHGWDVAAAASEAGGARFEFTDVDRR